ncbi:MAG: CDP-diacylglycerol--glycerol-3-phosphate 3-phosphatidyltransferase [Aeromicrobium sp.]
MVTGPQPDETAPEIQKPSNLNIANALTVLRIAGVPLFGWLLLDQHGTDVRQRIWAFVAFCLLMITDRIDGDIARSRGLVTNFGKLADPIADKALTGMAFVGLSIIGVLWWWVTIVLLVREWGITLMRFVVKKYGVMPASQGGRIKTTLQSVAIGGYLLPFELWDNTVSHVLRWGIHVTMAVAVAFTLVTAVQYVRDAVHLRREQKALTGLA